MQFKMLVWTPEIHMQRLTVADQAPMPAPEAGATTETPARMMDIAGVLGCHRN